MVPNWIKRSNITTLTISHHLGQLLSYQLTLSNSKQRSQIAFVLDVCLSSLKCHLRAQGYSWWDSKGMRSTQNRKQVNDKQYHSLTSDVNNWHQLTGYFVQFSPWDPRDIICDMLWHLQIAGRNFCQPYDIVLEAPLKTSYYKSIYDTCYDISTERMTSHITNPGQKESNKQSYCLAPIVLLTHPITARI